MGDRLKIFNVNSYSSFSRSNSIIYCSYLLCLNFLSFVIILCLSFSIFNYFISSVSQPRYLFLNHKREEGWLSINILSSSSWLRLVFWKSIHLEVASGPFCLLVNSPWLLVFALCIFFLSLSGFNLYCWRGIHFSWSNSLIFLVIFSNLLFSFHFWFRDLLRELAKKYEILLMVLFLLFFLFLASEALL